MNEKDVIEGAANAVAEHLPETTRALDNVVSSIVGIFDVLLAPFQALKTYKDVKMDEFRENLRIKSSKIPEEQLKDSLDLKVIGPALEALKYTFLEDDLREMFENLLASSIDKREDVFPSFVDIVRQLSSDEAKLLKWISKHGYDYPLIDLQFQLNNNGGFKTFVFNFTDIGFGVVEKPEITNAYLYDLNRFGIIDIFDDVFLKDDLLYKSLEDHIFIKNYKLSNPLPDGEYVIKKKKFIITDYGKAFLESCVIAK